MGGLPSVAGISASVAKDPDSPPLEIGILPRPIRSMVHTGVFVLEEYPTKKACLQSTWSAFSGRPNSLNSLQTLTRVSVALTGWLSVSRTNNKIPNRLVGNAMLCRSPEDFLWVLILTSLAMATLLLYADGGGLNKHGCHNSRKVGSYQCHRGQFAGRTLSSQAEMLKELSRR